MGEITLTEGSWYWVKETEDSDWIVARYSRGEWYSTLQLNDGQRMPMEFISVIAGPIPKPEGRWIIPKYIHQKSGNIITFE